MQVSFFKYLSLQYPHVRKVSFAIPNGVKTNITQARALVAEGLTKGCPDVFIAYPSNGYPGMFIEFKWGSNTTSPEQDEMLWLLGKQGYKTAIIYDLDSAIELVKGYLNA